MKCDLVAGRPAISYANQMDIKKEEKGKKGEFYIEEEGIRTARIQYFHSGEGQITVYHTEVDKNLRGKGIGEDLVERVVQYARDGNSKIVATCNAISGGMKRS